MLDPESATPLTPNWLGEQLAARGEDVEDLKQRHPFIPNDAPWPWNMTVAQGSWQNSNGSITIVECGPEVSSDNPDWEYQNLRYTRWAGGARCTLQMQAITGTVRLLQWNGLEPSFQVASAGIGSQHAVPPGHGFGYQAYGWGAYNRVSDSQNLQIHLQVTLEIQPRTAARWNIVPNACTRDANIRIIHCQLWSPPFRNAPYACPMWTVGVQPLPCTTPPGPCSQPQIGIQPNCVTPPRPCSQPEIGVEPDCVAPPTATAPQNTSAPVVTGNARERHTLTATPGTWAGTDPKTYAYQWRRCDTSGGACQDVPGAVQQHIELSDPDIGHTMRVSVTAANAFGASQSKVSAPTATVMRDGQGPQLSVSGPLRLTADDWIDDGTRQVVVSARDGTASDPQTGVRRIELRVDGVVTDAVERPCLTGNCELDHNFSVDTRALRYGAHDFSVRAVDERGNATADSWMVATEPVRTAFELSSPASLEEVYAAAVANQADIMDMTHSEPGVGGHSTEAESPSEAIASYRQAYREHYGVTTDPPVTAVTLGGVIATETLGPIAARVATREVFDLSEIASEDWADLAEPSLLYPDDLFNADVAAESQPYDTRDNADASVSATAKTFSPAYGRMWTHSLGPIARISIDQKMTWKEGSLDAFERSGYYDHAYEHDVKLYDNSYNGSRKHPFCNGQGTSWWATHRIVDWYTTYPDDADPWFDDNVGDNCGVLDLTIGIKHPLELEERKRYETQTITDRGPRDHSPYHLFGSKLARVCGGEPRVCAVREPGGDSQILIGKTKGDAPECRRWRKGRRSRPC